MKKTGCKVTNYIMIASAVMCSLFSAACGGQEQKKAGKIFDDEKVISILKGTGKLPEQKKCGDCEKEYKTVGPLIYSGKCDEAMDLLFYAFELGSQNTDDAIDFLF